MLTSNYKIVDPTERIKKKFVKENLNPVAPPIEDLAQEISLNKTATVPNDYQNKKTSAITGGSYNESAAPIDAKVLDAGDLESTDSKSKGTGAKVASAALGALDMAGTVMAQKGPMTRKESAANTLSLTAKGAQAGSSFGPTGMAIGAGVGLLTGVAMGIGDEKQLDDKAKVERLALLDKTKNDRMKAQKLEDGKASIEKSKAILESQMGMLKSNYTQTKTT